MKIILSILILLPTLAFAEAPTQMPNMIEWAQAQWKQHNGIMYLRVKIGSVGWCFTRSTSSITTKSNEWEYVAPEVVATIPATLEQIQVCTDTAPAWSVAPNPFATDTPPTRPLKDVNMVNKWRIAVGLPCEDVTVSAIKAGQEYHWAINASGVRGITVCKQ